MRILLLICVFFLQSIAYSFAQSSVDTFKIYKKSKSAPIFIQNNPQKLSKYLIAGLQNDGEKVLSIAYWICNNISYKYSGQISRSVEIKSSHKILKKKKATSLEYAKLFKEMCAVANIQAEIVHGYVKDFDFFPGDTLYRAEYAWNVVKIGNEWHIIDLTLAANDLEPDGTPFSKFMWAILRKPTTVKMKPVKRYSPQWICISPDKSIYTHMPILPLFQLLEYPITIDVFMRGDSLIHQYVSRYPQKTRYYFDLEKYIQFSDIAKYVYVAKNTLLENPFAHFNAAIYYYFAVEHFKNKNYLEEKARLFAPQDELRPMLMYSTLADSLFALSVYDDVRELKAFQSRSERWKRDLAEFNKIHQTNSQELSKRYTKQIQSIKKVSTQNTAIIAYIEKNKNVVQEKNIIEQSRPLVQKNSDMYEAIALKSQSDSLLQQIQAIQIFLDSQLQFVSNNDAQKALAYEKQALELNQKNTRILRNYITKKGNSMPMVYVSNKSIEKTLYKEYLFSIDSLNTKATDTLINFLNIQQPIVFEQIKNYNALLLLYTKNLQTIKSKLQTSIGEDTLYVDALREYTQYMQRVQTEFSKAADALPEISKILETHVQLLKECVEYFKKDNVLEVSRHTQYMEYRKKFRQIDTEYIKYFQKVNKEYRKIIQKALK
ncbi:MAG TPA: transglutaminase domain-containing protein [Bacteroidales bacterium]|nr:transglutaminase domain-containing protein [Bacteroidales bacterium]